ncbi:MAG: BMP family ABC transporter substrate-binding protein [Clostridia bacterium]|mgnify:FL=1|nr:BMP family ABC transporter substrate-binding protein [Eubacteriales bacterium]MDO4352508.1 BMP family ABC transporter substrate-binding protein [Clostridia bacterium]MDY2934557.1 BMP family ABC transporter substrate-binding protein [Anaerovoracaceae bacterium]MEE0180996.1 BMP family ABC transporter substrate-binding protein [Anaerovoracaceae bacterium]
MKKTIALLLSLVMVIGMVAFTGCGSKDDSSNGGDFKVGFICLHDENSTYDKNFIDAANAACEELGVEAVIKTNIPEGQECYDAAAELVDAGCGIVFADSFGHEDFMIQAAKDFPEVQFCHSTGTKAHTENLANYHNAFASIYEGRYLAGVAAGMKINEMIDAGTITADEAKMGYVGAYTYAEVVSGYTSFFLGARSVCESVTMEVTFTGSWYDEALEKEAANKLINDGCVLVSQHADSMGAPTACEKAGVPNVSYNGSTQDACPNTFIVSSRIDWTPYYVYAIKAAQGGEAIEADWTGNLGTGSVVLTDVNEEVAAEGTADKIAEITKKLEAGELQVFDITTFTVDGKEVDSYKADVDTDADYVKDTEVIENGAFQESKFRSAPYFDLQIDGIKLLDTKF